MKNLWHSFLFFEGTIVYQQAENLLMLTKPQILLLGQFLFLQSIKNMLIEFIVQLAYFMVVRLINALYRSLELLDSREYDIP